MSKSPTNTGTLSPILSHTGQEPEANANQICMLYRACVFVLAIYEYNLASVCVCVNWELKLLCKMAAIYICPRVHVYGSICESECERA